MQPQPQRTLRTPSEHDCQVIASAAEGFLAAARRDYERMLPNLSAATRQEGMARFDASAERTRAWLRAGCPEHPALGMYESETDVPGGPRGFQLLDLPQFMPSATVTFSRPDGQ